MAEKIIGVVLAGGRSTRMKGVNKCFLKLGDRTLLDHAIKAARPQVHQLLLNCNDSDADFSGYGLETIADVIEGYAGPLVGILSSLLWIKKYHPDCDTLATFPVDSPFCPKDLVDRLFQELRSTNSQIAIPRYGEQVHWAFGLWSLDLLEALQRYLIEQQLRKVQTWIQNQRCCEVDFNSYSEDPFVNINTPDDFETAKKRWQARSV